MDLTCPNCGAENRLQANFCDNCGQELAATCANCGTENRAGARFCDNCGNSLVAEQPGTAAAAQAPTQSRHAGVSEPGSSSALMPAELAQKLRDIESTVPSEERRVITMLFCDVTGSTAAAESMDPEQWQEVINGAFDHMIEPVYRYEGIVARLMGDGLLAFFGAPIAHEDDPERAVLAGLEIGRRVREYSDAVAAEGGPPIAVRVGINTGLVMVGRVGTDQKAEYTAMGNAVNIAARMEQTAEPGSVQVAEPTYRAAAARFEWESLGAVELKGQSEPVPAYRPLRELTRTLEAQGSVVVGRSDEMARLLQGLEGLSLGLGTVILVAGEAGLGKSRLIIEAKRTMASAGFEWIEAAGASYEAGTPYAFARRLLQALLNTEDLRASVDGLADGDMRMILNRLVDPQAGEANPAGFGESLVGVVERLITDRLEPIVVVCDDLQWADAPSLDMLAHVASAATEEALAIVAAFRPETHSAIGPFRLALERSVPQLLVAISVEPLAESEMDELLEQLAPHLDDGRRHELARKMGGNPLFAEELIRSLGDAGYGSVPDSLLTLLVTRLDQLSDDGKRAAQLASVLGDEFSEGLLAEMGGGDAVRELLRSRVLIEAARRPERRLAFRHGLMREATYSTVLRRDRVQYHRLAGEAIERVHSDDLAGVAAVLARQYRLADDARAVRYEIMAGRRAQALSAAREAIELLETARNGFLAGEADLTTDEIVALYTSLGRANELDSRHEEALAIYLELLDWAEREGDRVAELAVLSRLGLLHSTVSPLVDLPRGWEYTKRGLQLADELHDDVAEARLGWVSGHLEQDPVKRAAHLERALGLLRNSDERELLAFVLNDLHVPYGETGRMREAMETLHEARSLWEQLGNKAMLADSVVALGIFSEVAGQMADAEKYFFEALEMGTELGSVWLEEVAKINAARAHAKQGNFRQWYDAISPYMNRDLLKLPDAFATHPLFWGYLSLGRYRDVIALAEQVEETLAKGMVVWWADVHAARSVAFLRLGDAEAADEAHRRARELDPEWSSPLLSEVPIRMTTYVVERAQRDGDWDAAEKAVTRYEEVMGRLDAQFDLAVAQAFRARIAEGRDQPADEPYRAAAEALEPHSRWLRAEVLYHHGRVAGRDAAIEEARRLVQASLDGLPRELLSEIGNVPWLADLRG